MLNESAIDVFESFLDVKLPIDYREYLQLRNGERPEKNGFDIPGQSDDAVNRFYSLLSKNKSETIICAIKLYKNRVPLGMIPVGNDPGGNLMLMALRGKQRGCIYFWDHELESDDDARDFFENVTLLSEGFLEFFKSLY